MISSSILQSLVALGANSICQHQAFYVSYKDILKNFRECGKSDDEAYKRYSKAAEKELRKLHLLERNQRELLKALDHEYYVEHMVRLSDEYWEEK